MDCTVSTGAAAMMAVRVLLVGAPSCSQQCQCLLCKWIAHVDHFSQLCFQFQDHDVQEDKILLVSLLMAEMGVHSVAYAFPQVKIITTAVDKKVNDLFHIIPGIGEQCWGSRKDRTVLKSLKCKNKHCSTVFIFFIDVVYCCFLGNFGDRYFGTDAPPDWSDEDMDEPSY